MIANYAVIVTAATAAVAIVVHSAMHHSVALSLTLVPTMGFAVCTLALFMGFRKRLAIRRRKSFTRQFLAGKRVWITGASSGLGYSLSLAAARHGASLVLTARREAILREVAAECVEAGCLGKPKVLPVDLGGHCDELVKLAERNRLEDVDVLINNAGLSSRSRCEDTITAVDERLMRVNYLGPVALTKGVLHPMLRRRQGNLVFISSVQGQLALPFRSSYTASKHALEGYCNTLRAEIGSRGIGVLVVSAGYIATELSLNAVTGQGSSHNKMDANTAQGLNPDVLAEDILYELAAGSRRMMPGAPLNARLGILLHHLWPSLIDYVMAKRYRKEAKTLPSHEN